MSEPLKVNLATYNENDVKPALKLLVRCFNTVAASVNHSTMSASLNIGTTIEEGSKLFNSITGRTRDDAPIQLSPTEVSYLKSAFMETAAILEYIPSWSGTGDSINADMSGRADVFIQGAIENKIVKLASPHRERPL